MPLRTLVAALALAALPGIGFAACFGDHQKTTMSCADGTVWDATKGTCVAEVTG